VGERKGPLDQLLADGVVAGRAETPEGVKLLAVAARARSIIVSHSETSLLCVVAWVAMVRVAADSVRSAPNVPSLLHERPGSHPGGVHRM
jgi:hypothetical protein